VLEVVLQHDAERHPGDPASGDQLLRPRGGDLHRLLQQHMLARAGATSGDVEMGVGRRQHHYGVDRAIIEDALQAIGRREREACGEGFAPRRARAEGPGDLGAIGEVEQRLCMRRHRHAEAHQADASLRHGYGPNQRTGAAVSHGT
jgi:hypothetical protein